ncbi:hypothetical protein [Maricaulis maris]|jgi:hypothetical protein|uniref:hypothetical protein n=1 Tax=Maricaulis maris TaxID=74318 RepID=UPI0030C78565
MMTTSLIATAVLATLVVQDQQAAQPARVDLQPAAVTRLSRPDTDRARDSGRDQDATAEQAVIEHADQADRQVGGVADPLAPARRPVIPQLGGGDPGWERPQQRAARAQTPPAHEEPQADRTDGDAPSPPDGRPGDRPRSHERRSGSRQPD